MAGLPASDASGAHERGSAPTGAAHTAPANARVSDPGERAVLGILLVLTVLSGFVDGVCYLGLGHVFTANMTGNVVLLGFAAAGAPGFSVTASLTSLLVFLLAAIGGGRVSKHVVRRSRQLATAVGLEAIFVGAAAVLASTASSVSTGWARYTTIALLAFAMGIRNAVIRKLAVPDMTTTVLTMTLTGLAADSTLAGGRNVHAGRRLGSVLAMLAGAVIGASLFLHHGAGLPLAVSAGAAALAALTSYADRSAAFLDKP